MTLDSNKRTMYKTTMNKSQHENQSNQFIESEDIICNFEKKVSKLGKKNLENLMKKLNFLCLNFNPYDNQDKPTEVDTIIQELNLSDSLQNPFNFTNALLQMIDIVEQNLKRKIH